MLYGTTDPLGDPEWRDEDFDEYEGYEKEINENV